MVAVSFLGLRNRVSFQLAVSCQNLVTHQFQFGWLSSQCESKSHMALNLVWAAGPDARVIAAKPDAILIAAEPDAVLIAAMLDADLISGRPHVILTTA